VRAEASVVVPGRTAEAEALWYDSVRWPAWLEGFGHLVTITEGWPAAGARRVWDERAPGRGRRGRVVEHVLDQEARTGQTLAFEDERIAGTESVTFTPVPDGVRVTLRREWTPKAGGALGTVAEALVGRRRVEASLRATLVRFAAERRGDAELGLTG